jgi:hypothetical protein
MAVVDGNLGMELCGDEGVEQLVVVERRPPIALSRGLE